jgi:hypothetical protein
MGTVTTEQQKLVLNSFAMVLQNNLVTANAVTWDEYNGEMDDRNGLQVLEQVTPRYNITRTENGVKDLSAGTDGTVFGSELFEITGTFNANMGWGDFVAIRDLGDARKSKALLGAATSLASRRSTPIFCRRRRSLPPIGPARRITPSPTGRTRFPPIPGSRKTASMIPSFPIFSAITTVRRSATSSSSCRTKPAPGPIGRASRAKSTTFAPCSPISFRIC